MDSITCAEIFAKQLKHLNQQQNVPTYIRQPKLVEPLSYMMERGIRADVDGMKLERQRMMDKANELQEELNFLAGRPLNPNPPTLSR